MDQAPIAGVTLEQYYEVLVLGRGVFAEEDSGAAVARSIGISDDAWRQAKLGWTERTAKGTSPADVDLITKTYRAALDKRAGDPPPFGLEAYQEICVSVQLGKPMNDAFRDHGLDVVAWAQVSYRWMDILAADRRMNALFVLRCQKEIRERQTKKERGKRWSKPKGLKGATRIRARQCSRCGGHKLTPHDRPWIACDFCSALFDYDVHVRQPKGEPDHKETWESLISIINAEDWPTDAAGHRARFCEAQSWAHEVQIEMCPSTYPARAQESEYRKRLIERWLVPAAAGWTFDEACKKTSDALSKQYLSFVTRHDHPKLQDVFKLYDRLMENLAAQCAVLARENLYEAHPDGMDEALYLRSMKSSFAAAWLPTLSAADGDKLLERAGMKEEYLTMPAADLRAASCGSCGADVVSPEGAKATVCLHCGHVLDATRHFECRGCGAELFKPAGKEPVSCGYCKMRWEAV